MRNIARALAIGLALALSLTMPAAAQDAAVTLDVYKSPHCHCCVDWIKRMEQDGFSTRTHHPADLDAQKSGHGVPAQYTSCHTSVSAEGYVFEGHVPAKFIRRFLANPPPGARGLLVPGMPLGSPGMESDDFFMPYKILLLKQDGTVEVHATISKASEQFDEEPATPPR